MVRRPTRASGRFLLRIDPRQHGTLRRAARAAGLSLNDYCSRKLSLPGGCLAGPGESAAIVARAAELFAADLVGVVVFGSWARGEETERSDVDALVVLAERVALLRRLYREWDAEPVVCDGHPVEPHFVHLPPPKETVAGLWAEVALDGIVLFDPTLVVSHRLAAIRRDIAGGRIVRRVVHGQPYWVSGVVA
jgi:predicted nucleotidyltransferase